MPSRSSEALLATLLILLLSTGCDDPSNVGVGLVDAQTGTTIVESVDIDLLVDNELADLTGGNAGSGAVRVLAGAVEDPLAGAIVSTGYLDFVPSSQFSSTFLNSPVTFAQLDLSIDYVYGDSTLPVSLDLRRVPQNWISALARADTTLETGSSVMILTIPPKTGVYSFLLPAEWIAENDALLRNSGFTDNFHGFALRALSGNAIVGARFADSRIRASSTPGDTVSFIMSKVLTTTVRDPSASNFVLLQDGGPSGLDISFPFKGDQFPESLIHRVSLRVPTADVSSLYPTNFVRPRVSLVGLRAISEDRTTRLDIAEVALGADGTLIFDNTSLTNVVQSANLGKSPLDRFELYVPSAQSGVGFLAIENLTTPENTPPRAIITHTPLN